MVIEVSVTPVAVAPLASPAPQGDLSVPKVAPEGAVVEVPPAAVVAVVPSPPDPWLPPQAAASTLSANAHAHQRTDRLRAKAGRDHVGRCTASPWFRCRQRSPDRATRADNLSMSL